MIELLGIGSDNLRVIGVDAADRMRISELGASLRRDRAAGYVPMGLRPARARRTRARSTRSRTWLT
ncbi:MAG: hypothetical protein M3069_19625 [Chloroflexota bacterium]|nr:hypothetical protein [Chloroflexota bacterium]